VSQGPSHWASAGKQPGFAISLEEEQLQQRCIILIFAISLEEEQLQQRCIILISKKNPAGVISVDQKENCNTREKKRHCKRKNGISEKKKQEK